MNEVSRTAVAKPRPSPWFKFWVETGPLILFFFANARPKLFEPAVEPFLPPAILNGPNAGLFTATLVLMAAVIAALAVSFWQLRRLPMIPLLTAALVLVFGALTLYLQNATFIKMKPTMLYACFGVALIGGLLFKKSILPIVFDNALALTERGWQLSDLAVGLFLFRRLRS